MFNLNNYNRKISQIWCRDEICTSVQWSPWITIPLINTQCYDKILNITDQTD